MDHSRLSMPIGEAMFTQRSIRRFRPDPIPTEDVELILAAASKAPNGGNNQIGRFLVVQDRELIRQFGPLYKEAWWAKRHDQYGWTGPQDVAPDHANYQNAIVLTEEMQDAPLLIFILAVPPGNPLSVVPAAQNLMLAARALGIGSIPTRLHPSVMSRWRALFGVPDEIIFHLCIPMGYPRGRFGSTQRWPTHERCFWNRWGGLVPWSPDVLPNGTPEVARSQ